MVIYDVRSSTQPTILSAGLTVCTVHLDRLGSLSEETVRFYMAELSSAVRELAHSDAWDRGFDERVRRWLADPSGVPVKVSVVVALVAERFGVELNRTTSAVVAVMPQVPDDGIDAA